MAGRMIVAVDQKEISIASLHVASGRFTSVLDPKQIVGFAPWQEANARLITVASAVGPKRTSPNGPQHAD
jgi:hypothetical protein